MTIKHMSTCEKTKAEKGGLTAGLLYTVAEEKKTGKRSKKACMHVWRSLSESGRRGLKALVVVD